MIETSDIVQYENVASGDAYISTNVYNNDNTAHDTLDSGTHASEVYKALNMSSHHTEGNAYQNFDVYKKDSCTTDTQDPDGEETSESDTSSFTLRDGNKLLEESRTEIPSNIVSESFTESDHKPEMPTRKPTAMATSLANLSNGTGTAKSRAARSPFTAPPLDSIPEVEVVIPNDGNISSFTCDQVASFLRYLNVEDRIISHLHRKNVDGKRFSRLRDSELENLGMKNPVVIFFREKSSTKPNKKKNVFIL